MTKKTELIGPTKSCLLVALAAGMALLVGASSSDATSSPADSGWDELSTLSEELVELRSAERIDGVPQYGAAAIEQRAGTIAAGRKRLAEIDASSWTTAGKVDYLLVWARLNALDFEHRVTRPWQRDPIHYLNLIRRVPYVDLPLEGEEAEKWAGTLRAVPATLEQAETEMTKPSGELARLAVFHLENFDGVGQGQPYRDAPPEGTLGWYVDLCERVASDQPELSTDCQAALAAATRYRDWLARELPRMPASAGIGRENLAWYFRHVRLLPYSVGQMAVLGEREFHRFRAAYEIVRNRNRKAPELPLTQSAEEHESRTREAERKIRELVDEQELMTLPEDLPATFDTDTFWSPRALTDRHFWEEIQFRNAFNNHIHASIPGHRFDGRLARQVENPIRRNFGDSSRAEGWATYLEEMFVLAGLTRDVPRADELFYVALMKRASRIYAETQMHSGEMSLEEANRYMIDYVPYMEADLGRYDLEGYLRRPGLGAGYIIGKIQLEQLLSESAIALGDDFDLGAFHDEILKRGMIPLTLVRWELTGDSDEVAPLWQLATGTDLPDRP